MQFGLTDQREFDSTAREKDHNNVANVDPRVIQTLLDDIERLRKTIIDFMGSRSSRLEGGKLDKVRAAVLGGAAQFDSVQWCRLSEQRRKELQEQLIMVRDTLLRDTLLDVARREGRDEPSGIPDGLASTKSIIWLAIFGFVFAATLLSLIR
jgi:hypothetical protein